MAMSVILQANEPHYSLSYWCEAFTQNQLRNSSPFLFQESKGFNFLAPLKLNTSMLIDVSRSLTWWLGVINLYWWEWQSSRFEISGLQTSLLKPIVSQIKYCIQLSYKDWLINMWFKKRMLNAMIKLPFPNQESARIYYENSIQVKVRVSLSTLNQ